MPINSGGMPQPLQQLRNFRLALGIRSLLNVTIRLQTGFSSRRSLANGSQPKCFRRPRDLVQRTDQSVHLLRRMHAANDQLPQRINAGNAIRQFSPVFRTERGQHLPEFIVAHDQPLRLRSPEPGITQPCRRGQKDFSNYPTQS